MFSYLPKQLLHLSFLPLRRFSFCCPKQNSRIKLLSLNFKNDFKVISSNFCSKSPCLPAEEEYAAFSQKLEAIPYLELMNNGLKLVRQDLVEDNNPAIADALQWITEVFDYNVTHGKKIRAVALLKAFAAYTYKEENDAYKDFNSNEWKSAVILAWCIEMLQAFFIIADDIMDQSKMRRGAPCWYQHPNVGLCAINDSLLLHCGVFKLLEKHFRHKNSYDAILHEFIKVTSKTVYGQCLDMLSNPPSRGPNLENFTFERYQTLVEYKTSYYTYCLPVHLAMHLVGRHSEADFKVARDLCLKLGLYFQSQDDYLDCFGDPRVTGKFSNDINEGKCTWFAVKFLEIAPHNLQEEFQMHFGVNKSQSISQVLLLYDMVSLKSKFEEFDAALSSDIKSSIKTLNNMEAGLFYNLFSQITKRNK